jgi:putative transposase
MVRRGGPQAIRFHNRARADQPSLPAWYIEHEIELVHTQPGKPTQNADVESFRGRLREDSRSTAEP